MGVLRCWWELGSDLVGDSWCLGHDAEVSVPEPPDEAVVLESVDRLGEARLGAERVAASCPEPELAGEGGGAHGHGLTTGGEESPEVASEQDGGRSDEGQVDDLEVRVRQPERAQRRRPERGELQGSAVVGGRE